MSFTPKDSAIKLTAEDEQKISQMLPDEMKLFFREKACSAGLITLDAYSGDPIPTPLADNAPQKFAETLVMSGGRRVIIEADSPESLALQVASAKRVAEELSKPPKADVTPRDSATGRFTSQADDGADVAARVDLELKFKRGEITTDEWLQQSGAVERRLKSIGVDVDSLQQQSWENSTREFLARNPSWQGGDAAKRAIAQAVAALGLEGQPSVETLEKAYAHLRSTNPSVLENPDLQRQRDYEREIANCKTSAEIHQITARYFGTYGSSL